MITSEFAIDFAQLVKAATTLRTLTPLARPTTVTMYSEEHDAVFRVEVTSVGTVFGIVVSADGVSGILTQNAVDRTPEMLQDIAKLIEQAEEAFDRTVHQAALIDLIAEHDPDPAELLTFCERAGIEINGSGLSAEDCATISSWLQVSAVREKAAAKPATVVEFGSGSQV